MHRIYRAPGETLVENAAGRVARAPAEFSFDALFASADPAGYAASAIETGEACGTAAPAAGLAARAWLAPVGSQEIWAAGVTYRRSRNARIEESETSGADRFYDLVYEAERPELFFKSTAARARGHLEPVRIRADSAWNVPEPELTLAIGTNGAIFGFTIGNDMSSRAIEGENPLYLPQAKVYRGACAVGPCLVVGRDAVGGGTSIALAIERGGDVVFSGETAVSRIKRGFDELVEFLFRENEFPHGALLMTGTGIVPDPGFTLRAADRIRITIEPIGTLENTVE